MGTTIRNGMNLNDRVWVRLNDVGWELFRRHYFGLGLDPTSYVESLRAESADGWVPFQMWEILQIFGPSTGMGMLVPFEGNEIRFDPEPAR